MPLSLILTSVFVLGVPPGAGESLAQPQGQSVLLELAGFHGTLFDAGVAAEYRLGKHLALGVGYNGMIVDVFSADRDPDYPGTASLGRVDVRFHGVTAFVKVTF